MKNIITYQAMSIRSNSLLYMKSLYEIKIVTNKINNIHIASYLFTYILRYLTDDA